MTTVVAACKDCTAEGVTTKRKMATRPDGSLQPGPRCVTHHRAARKRTKNRAHERRIETTYSITPEDYQALYELQGGHCFICGVATGKVRRLSVDHDHKICTDHSPVMGCPKCIRGLLCLRCNQLIGWYGIESLCRAVFYLQNPPARQYFETRIAKAEYL